MSTEQLAQALRKCAEAAWHKDSHRVHFDSTVAFGPHYNFCGLDGIQREEFLGEHDCIVWPCGSGRKWSAYCTYQGSMWFEKFDTVKEAKAVCMELLAKVSPNDPFVKACALLVAHEAEKAQGGPRKDEELHDASVTYRDGMGEPYNCFAAGPTATDLALWQAMNEAEKYGLRTDVRTRHPSGMRRPLGHQAGRRSSMKWFDARKKMPPPTDRPVRYLVILDTLSPVQHCKDWAGVGEPEIAAFCSQWAPYPWYARGSLEVAYWMPLPPFRKQWDKTVNGQPGKWIDAASKEGGQG